MEGPGHSDTATMAMTAPSSSSAPHLKRKRSPSSDQTPQRYAHDARPPRPVAGPSTGAMTATASAAPVAAPTAAMAGPAAPAGPPPAAAAAAPKAAKPHNHLQINYLARQNKSDLALAATRDTMPEIIELLNSYQGVLDRHESLACNLGARPLGPILIKRFERLFDGPPRVLKSHGSSSSNKEGEQVVTWLDVVEFARNKPEQFTLGQVSEGRKVCQFYTKQSRVQISEDDYVLLNSGIPQKMIPPQPIVEDEEKELGTLEILEERLAKICQLADQVAARTRQLNHRIKGRKQAILDRRATEPSFRPMSPPHNASANGGSALGFVTVSSRPHDANGSEYSKSGASAATRHELLERFATLGEQRAGNNPSGDAAGGAQGGPVPTTAGGHHGAPDQELAALLMASNNTHPQGQAPYGGSISGPSGLGGAAQAVPAYYPDHNGGSPSHYHATAQQPAAAQAPPQQQPRGGTVANHFAAAAAAAAAQERDANPPNDGPFKSEMVARMEALGKGERVVPPCDRCRRLHMDCLKNLTACAGCTKKHAKCAWREVREEEMIAVRSGGEHGAAQRQQEVYRATEGVDARTPSPGYEGAQQYGQQGQQQHHDGYQAEPQAPIPAPDDPTAAEHAYGQHQEHPAAGTHEGGDATSPPREAPPPPYHSHRPPPQQGRAAPAEENRDDFAWQDFQAQLRLLEQQNRGREAAERERRDNAAGAAGGGGERNEQQRYQDQLAGLEEENQRRLRAARERHRAIVGDRERVRGEAQEAGRGAPAAAAEASTSAADVPPRDAGQGDVDEHHVRMIRERLLRAQQDEPDAAESSAPGGGGGQDARDVQQQTDVVPAPPASAAAADSTITAPAPAAAPVVREEHVAAR